jgi:histidyl-tRNA synthetase
MQFDADTVGAESVAADAEMCMLAADTLEALGIKRGDYVIKVNNRKLLDGVLWSLGLDYTDAARHAAIFRALDKFDRLGMDAVKLLLGKGRKDESGDFTPGAELTPKQIESVTVFMLSWDDIRTNTIKRLDSYFSNENEVGRQGLEELRIIDALLAKAGYEHDQVVFDGTVVRGLDYYTGPVFETDLTTTILDDEGKPVRFGSVGSGGRYDGLVARFTGERVPATGFSIGVSRLQAALSLLGSAKTAAHGPVVVLVMEKDRVADYQKLVQTLRSNDSRAELYLGSSGMKAQMKYADKRGSPCVVIQGSDERAKGEVTLKDLVEGAKAAAAIKDNKEWKEARPAQVSVKEAALVAEVRRIIARHKA